MKVKPTALTWRHQILKRPASMHLKWMIVLLFLSFSGFAQKKSIGKLLRTYNSGSVPYISVEELKMKQDEYLILDSRKAEEFEVSHLPNAIRVDDRLDETTLERIRKSNKKIVVYCSVGVRSEDFGEKLQKKTGQPVFNLYGGIFAWKDAGFPIFNDEGKPTERVHTFSKNWQDYLSTGIAVY
ncbi:rhodanese-like domain-containing protein [Leeuwenhoekiella sp. H156]|uniref:rhodanese-like domain-containing protein n=1 Tax=Leeuwenhoekiella sp. H156 TaxID=3450128 RepID=UPI003FA4D159